MRSLTPGAEIAGYRLEEVLGRGGMGVVWQAQQVALDRPVALKVLSEALAGDAEFQQRFILEAKLAARIRHPNVVIVHDARKEDGVLILAMELVRGSDLSGVLADGGPLEPLRAGRILEQVAGALDAAHAEGLVHRDVKPANILISGSQPDEHAYLTDFGLSKALAEAAQQGLTRQGMMVGTADYMAPEQVRGEAVDGRADVYSLGCVLFEMLVARKPYPRDTEVAILYAQVNDPVPSLIEIAPQLPPQIDAVLARGMAKDPAERFASAGELASAFRGATDGVAPHAAPAPTTEVSDDTRWEGHAVVAGLGRTGARLAGALDAAGYRVVAIELDTANPRIAECRADGIPVLVGDAADPGLLGRAAIEQALQLIVACGEDAVNLNVATVAEGELEAGREGVLTTFVHLRDLALLRAMKVESLRGSPRKDFRLELFNPYLVGTRLLLERHPPFEPDVASAHLCVVGDGVLATTLILLLAAAWPRARSGTNRLPLVMTGPRAGEHAEEILSQYPQVGQACRLDPRPADIRSAPIQSGEVLLSPDGTCPVTQAYVALEDESQVLEAALGLHGSPATQSVPLVVALADEESPMANVLRARSRSFTQGIEPFGVLSSALTPELLLRGMNELLARANHQTYLRERRAEGATDGPSTLPWEELPESLRNSNRRFADGIGAALDAIGCSLVPEVLPGTDGPQFTLSDQELELLARREHERWMADLIRDGWRLGTGEKDPEQKLHPLLVPWEQLSEAEREKDRDAVRAIPDSLAQAGFEVIRPGGGGPATPVSGGAPPPARSRT